MILDKVQTFASPMEALSHISEAAWSDYTKADYTVEQWHAACLIHIHDGAPTSKSECKLPVKTPDGALNRNGVHAAAAALAGARGGLKGVSEDQKSKAAAALKRYYSQLDEDPPDSLAHYGVKGMRWGVRRTNAQMARSERLMGKAHELEERSVDAGPVSSRVLQKRATSKRHTSVDLRRAVHSKVMEKTNESAQKELKALRKRPEFKDINYRDDRGHPRFDTEKFRALEKAESQIWMRHLNKTVSGYEFSVKTSNTTWDLIPKEVKHAESTPVVRVKPIRDEDGFLIDVEFVDIVEPDTLAQTMDLGTSFVLEHYGVKGMRWGVRNEDPTGGRPSTGRIERLDTTKASIPSVEKPLSSRNERRVKKYEMRAEIAGTKISELKRENEKFEGTRNPIKLYARGVNRSTIKDLERAQKRALRDAQDAQKGKKLTSTQKKAIIGGVAVAAVIGGAYVYTRGQQSGAFNALKLVGSARLKGQSVPFKTDSNLSKAMSAEELLAKVAKPVNPNYKHMGGKMNCRRSTFVYELRRRGFDVEATTSAVGWGQSESGVINALSPGGKKFYDSLSLSKGVVNSGGSVVARGDTRTNPVAKTVLDNLLNPPSLLNPNKTESSSARVLAELAKQPNGARGEVVFKFSQFGHSMAYEIVDGVPHIFDSQKGTLYNATNLVESKWDGFSGAEIMRLDNVNLDLNFLARWADNHR